MTERRLIHPHAANAEESASASEELSAQAKAMNDMVNELAVLVGGCDWQQSDRLNKNRGQARHRARDDGHSRTTTRRPGTPPHPLGKSGVTFHQIAKNDSKTVRPARTSVTPSVPLGDDDLEGVNS